MSMIVFKNFVVYLIFEEKMSVQRLEEGGAKQTS